MSSSDALWRSSLSLTQTRNLSVRERPFARCRFECLAAHATTDRVGLTLLELLVTISLIGLLLSLLLPAVQAAREAARRAQCAANLHQIGLAVHGYVEATNVFPPGLLIGQVDGQYVTLPNLFSPHARILPYLGYAGLCNSLNFEVSAGWINLQPVHSTAVLSRVSLFHCPSDLENFPGGTNYRFCTGAGICTAPGLPTSPDSGTGAFITDTPLGSQDISDGLSHTVFVSERVQGSNDDSRFHPDSDWFWMQNTTPAVPPADDYIAACNTAAAAGISQYSSDSGYSWLGAEYNQTLYNHALPPNSHLPDCGDQITGGVGLFSARSRHRGGVHTLFGDGSVRFVGESISLDVWRALSTRAGGEQVSNDEF